MGFKPLNTTALDTVGPVRSNALKEKSNFDWDKYDYKSRVNLMNVSPLYQDVADIAAFNQSTSEKWLNGAVKATYTAGVSALDPFVSLTYGIGEFAVKGASKGNFEFADIINNSVSQMFDAGAEALREELPNLYTKAAEEASVMEGLGTANFWADKLLGGAGYMAGAYLSTLMSAGLGGPKAARQLAKLFAGNQKALSATATAAEIEAATMGLKGVSKATASNAIENFLYGSVAAWGESSAEARGVINQVKNSLIDQKLYQKGINVSELSEEEKLKSLSKEELAEIQSYANSAGNVALAINLPITGLTNAVTLRGILKGTTTTGKAAMKANARLSEIALEGSTAAIKKPVTKLGKFVASAGKTADVLKEPGSEAFQELAQFVTETGTIDQYENPTSDNPLYKFIQGTAFGLEKAFGTKEGIESMLLGAILGGVGIKNGIKERAAEKKELQTIVDELNKWKSTDTFKDKYKNSSFALNSINKMQESGVNNSSYKFNNEKDELTANYFNSRFKAGLEDETRDEINNIKQMGIEEYRNWLELDANMSDSEVKDLQQKHTAALLEDLNKSKETYNKINTAFASAPQSIRDEYFKLAFNIGSVDKRLNSVKTNFYNATKTDNFNYDINEQVVTSAKGDGIKVKDLLEAADKVANASKEELDNIINNYNTKAQQLKEDATKTLEELQKSNPNITATELNTILNSKFEDANKELNDLKVQYEILTGDIDGIKANFNKLRPEQREEAANLLKDVLKLSNRKSQIITLYNELTSNPDAKARFYIENAFDKIINGQPSKPDFTELRETLTTERDTAMAGAKSPEELEAIEKEFEDVFQQIDTLEQKDKQETEAVKTQVNAAAEAGNPTDFFGAEANQTSEQQPPQSTPIGQPVSSEATTVENVVPKTTLVDRINQAKKEREAKQNNLTAREKVELAIDYFKNQIEYHQANHTKTADVVAKHAKDLEALYKLAEKYEDTETHTNIVSNPSSASTGISDAQKRALNNLLRAKMLTEEEYDKPENRLEASYVINEGVKRINALADTDVLDSKTKKALRVLYTGGEINTLERLLNEANTVLKLVDSNSVQSNVKTVTNSLKVISGQKDAYLTTLEKVPDAVKPYVQESLSNTIQLLEGLQELTGIVYNEVITPEVVVEEVSSVVTQSSQDPVIIEPMLTDNGSDFVFVPAKKTDSITVASSFFTFDKFVGRDNLGEAVRDTKGGAGNRQFQDFINTPTSFTMNDVKAGDLVFIAERLNEKYTPSGKNQLTSDEWQELSKATGLSLKELKDVGEASILLNLRYKKEPKGNAYIHTVHYVNEESMGFERYKDPAEKKEAILNERVRLIKYRKSVLDSIDKGQTIIPITGMDGGFPNYRRDSNGKLFEDEASTVIGPLDKAPIGIMKGESNEVLVKGELIPIKNKVLRPGAIYYVVEGYGGTKHAIPLKTRKLNRQEATLVGAAIFFMLQEQNTSNLTPKQLQYIIESHVGKNRVTFEGGIARIKRVAYKDGEIQSFDETVTLEQITNGTVNLQDILESINYQVSPLKIGKTHTVYEFVSGQGFISKEVNYADYLTEQKVIQTSLTKTKFKVVQPVIYLGEPLVGQEAKNVVEHKPIDIKVQPVVTNNKKAEIEYNRNINKEQKDAGAPVLVSDNNKWLAYYTPEKEKGYVSFNTQQEALSWIDTKYDAELAALNQSNQTEEDEDNTLDAYSNSTPFRLATREAYRLEDIEKGKAWVNAKLGSSISVGTYSKLIRVGQSTAHGYFEAAVDGLAGNIMLWDNAEEGTVYHEAFHAVFRLFLTNEERKAILKEIRAKFPNKSELELEEILAENFREYILNDGEVAADTSEQAKSFFQQLKELLEAFWDLVTGKKKESDLTITNLFDRIDKGYYKEAVPVDNITENFKDKVFSLKPEVVGELTPKQSMDILEHLDASIHAFIFNPANKSSLRYLTSKLGVARLNQGYDAFFKYYETLAENAEKNNKPRAAATYRKYLANKASIIASHLNHLKKFDINVVISDEELTAVQSGEVLSLDKLESIHIDMKDNMKAEIKFFLSMIPKVKPNGQVEVNSLGVPKKSDWQGTYKLLQRKLSNSTSYDEIMERMESLALKVPEVKYVVDNLKLQSIEFKIAFAQAFYQQHNNFILNIIDPELNSLYRYNPADNNAENAIAEEWFTNFKSRPFIKEDGEGNLIIDNAILKTYHDEFLKIEKLKKSSKKGIKYPIKETIAFAEKLGIVYRPKAVQYLTPKEEEIIYQNVAYIIKSLYNDTRQFSTESYVFKEQSKNLLQLAVFEADVRQDLQNDVHLNAEGKPVFNYSLTTNLNDVVQKFNKGDLQGIDVNIYSGNSIFKKQIEAGNQITLGITEGIAVKGSNNRGVTYKDMSPADYAATRVSNMLKGVTNVDPSVTAKSVISNLQAADKSTSYSFSGFDLTLTLEEVKAMFKLYSTESDGDELGTMMYLDFMQSKAKEAERKVIDIFKGYFLDELKRIVHTRAELGILDNSTPYTALLKKILPDTVISAEVLPKEKWILPYHSKDGINPNGFGTQFTIFDMILSKPVKDYFDKGGVLVDNKLLEQIETDIKNYIGREVRDNKKFFIENKVIIERGDSVINIGLDEELFNAYNNDLSALAYHFTINDLIGKIELTKLIIGDLAFFKDLFKRVPMYQATGKVAMSSQDIIAHVQNEIYAKSNNTKHWVASNHASIVAINDLTRNSDNDEGIKELIPHIEQSFKDNGFSDEFIARVVKAFNNTNSTDGSMWSVPEVFKEFHVRLGDWDMALQEPIYQKVIRGERITTDEYATFAGFKSTKLVYAGKSNTLNNVQPAVYLKTAVAPPLIPGFAKGEIKKLVDKMYKDQIHFIAAESSSKAATPNIVKAFKDNGAIDETANFVDSKLNLPWTNFRENLEIDPFKQQEDVLAISQPRKLIWSGIFVRGEVKNPNRKIEVAGHEIGFNKAWELFNKAHDWLAKKAANDLKKKFGVELQSDGTFKITNLKGVIKLLEEELDEVQENLKEQIKIITDENGNEKLLMPFDVTTLGNKIQQKLNNLLSERVVRQKTKGSTNALVSNAGFYTIEDNTIKRSTDLKAYVHPKEGLVLEIKLPAHFKEYFGGTDNLDDIDPRLLRMLGFRVPTQGLNSIHKLKVVGFLDKNSGDVIMLPSPITTISGADFDIDKMFIFKPNEYNESYSRRTFKNEEVRELLAEFLESGEYLEFKQAVANNAEGLQKPLLERQITYLTKSKQEIVDLYDKLSEEELTRIHKASYVRERINNKGKETEVLTDIYTEDSERLLAEAIKGALSKYAEMFREENKSKYKINYLEPVLDSVDESFDSFNLVKSGKKEVQNLLFEIYYGLLSNTDNLYLQTMPNNADQLVELRNEIDSVRLSKEEFETLYTVKEGKIKKNPLSYTDYIEFTENAKAFVTFLGGKAGVGQTAVHNAHHVLAQIYDIKFTRDSFENIKLPFNKDKDGNIELSGDKDSANKNYISDVLSQFLTAFVDIAKDPFIFDLNANTITTNNILLLVRAGVPLDYAMYFINQPIIKDFVKETVINESQIMAASKIQGKGVHKKKKDIINSLKGYYSKRRNFGENDFKKEYTLEQLKSGLSIPTNWATTSQEAKDAFGSMQIDVLDYFLELTERAKELQLLLRASNTDSKGVGKEMWLVDVKLHEIEKIFNNPNLINVDKTLDYNYIAGKIEKENPNFLESFTRNSVGNANDWFTEQILLQRNPAFKKLFFEIAKKQIKSVLNDEETVDDLFDERYFTNDDGSLKKIRQLMFFAAIAHDGGSSTNIDPDSLKDLFITPYDVPKNMRYISKGYNLTALKNKLYGNEVDKPLYTLGANRKGSFIANGKYKIEVGEPTEYFLPSEYEGGADKFAKDLGYTNVDNLLNSSNETAKEFVSRTDNSNIEELTPVLVSKVENFEQLPLKKNEDGKTPITIANAILKLQTDISNFERIGLEHPLADNVVIHNVTIELANRVGEPDLVRFNNKVGDPEFKKAFLQDWSKALEDTRLVKVGDEHIEVRELFERLAVYSLYQSGLSDNPYSMFRMIPGELYTKLTKPLQQDMGEFYEYMAEFIEDDIVANLVNNNNIVGEVSLRKVTQLNQPVITEDGKTVFYHVGIIVPTNLDNNQHTNKYIKVNHTLSYKQKETLSTAVTKRRRRNKYKNYKLYKRVGTNLDGAGIYVIVPTKGRTNKFVEMGIETDNTVLPNSRLDLPKDYKAYVADYVNKSGRDAITSFEEFSNPTDASNVEAQENVLNIYYGGVNSSKPVTSDERILSNLAKRHFTWQGKKYYSVEHAYQTNKSGKFNITVYNMYTPEAGSKLGANVTKADMKTNLQLMKNLVVHSFREHYKEFLEGKNKINLYEILTKYSKFVHNNSTEVIDVAFLEGIQTAKKEAEEIMSGIQTKKIIAKGKMTYSYNSNKRPGITSTTTLEAIKKGERTATTRYESDGNIDYWKKLDVGDVVEWEGQGKEKVLVEITKPLHKLLGSGKTAEQWSVLEGWSVEYFNSNVRPKLNEAWQIEYKVISSIQAISKEELQSKEFIDYLVEKGDPSISLQENYLYYIKCR